MIKVTCAILEHQERVLVAQRSPTMSQPLLWEFPGGKVEPAEPEKAALVREIKEELHLEVDPVQRLTPVQHAYGEQQIELIPYICHYKSGEILLLEHSAYEWAELEALPKYDWCSADRPIVTAYLRLKSGL
ncbi:(deoxy)nucleoside triphosphate pyrophosphohydrolase [Pontibacter chitinilyticus]|uniref:(deoxy)nucleoside triphosphate pyrophosphohydrolase n=1 Tax=Pontibacter chitinilyticus TaxID=2674989 RepID=UPI00321A0DDC